MIEERIDRLKMVCVSQKYLHRWDALDGNLVTPVEVLELISDVLKWRAAADKNSIEAATLQTELWQWKDGIGVDKCNRCGAPPPLMLFQYHDHSGSDTGFAFCKKCYAPVVRGDYEDQKKKAAEKKEADKAKFMVETKGGIEIVEAGVDPSHQTNHCDDCGHVFESGEDFTRTCSASQYLTLCRPCYRKRGNAVR